MSSFSAAAPNTYIGTIENNGFWPDLEISHFMTQYRQDARLDEDVIKNALVDAVLVVNDEVREWTEYQWDEFGYDTVDAIQAEQIGGRHLYVVLYERAVFNRAKGELMQIFADYKTTTGKGQGGADRAEEKERLSDHYYAESLKAIRRIKGKTGTRVKLVKGNIQGQPGQFF